MAAKPQSHGLRESQKGGASGATWIGKTGLHLDLASGAAGDMLLAALLDSGVPREPVDEALSALGFPQRAFELARVVRGGIRSAHLQISKEAEDAGLGCRTYAAGRELLEKAPLERGLQDRALEVFQSLAEAEASVHGASVDEIHFHEVGATDTLIDIVGVSAVVEWLAPTHVSASRVAVGGGTVDTQHGRLPVPAPATLELLKGVPIARGKAPEEELLTPTGAALVSRFVDEFGVFPPMKVAAIGYGAGTKELKDRPNVVRVTWGSLEDESHGGGREGLLELRANLDDATPEVMGYLTGELLQMGVLDVWLQQGIMKKGRPGVVIHVLIYGEDLTPVKTRLFRESSTFGVRWSPVERSRLERASVRVETPFGEVSVMVGKWAGQVVTVSPEYESCLQTARERGVPLKLVYAAAKRAYEPPLASSLSKETREGRV